MKQTAVEWLASNLGEHIIWEKKIIDLIEEALEMEKEQIMQAFANGKINGNKNWPQKYYRETYETKTN